MPFDPALPEENAPLISQILRDQFNGLDAKIDAIPAGPEVREYRMRYWDKGTPNDDWTDISKVTVAP